VKALRPGKHPSSLRTDLSPGLPLPGEPSVKSLDTKPDSLGALTWFVVSFAVDGTLSTRRTLTMSAEATSGIEDDNLKGIIICTIAQEQHV